MKVRWTLLVAAVAIVQVATIYSVAPKQPLTSSLQPSSALSKDSSSSLRLSSTPSFATPILTPSPSSTTPKHVSTSARLQCIRDHESNGNYQENTGNGFYGAYQFLQSTWNSVADLIGRPDLKGVLPNLVSPPVQDQAAAMLLQTQGTKPWPKR